MEDSMLTKKEIAAMMGKIEKHRIAVGKVRDKLDQGIAEMEALRDCCDRAMDDLENARDALSEQA
jgi:uncharacterized membrane protein